MEPNTGQLCIPNISEAERDKRLKGGVILFVISLVVLITLVATGVSAWWRLTLFPLFMSAASGYFQARDKT